MPAKEILAAISVLEAADGAFISPAAGRARMHVPTALVEREDALH
jgi:hypothetical protein